MHVAALPAFASPTGNQYNALLSRALQRLGVTVDEWHPGQALRRRVDVVHVHWPEIPLNLAKPAHAAARTTQLLVGLAAVRARGTPVVWTAHNISSHLQRRPRAERMFWPVMDRLIDGWITLSDASVPAVVSAHPRLATRPHVTSPHGHYRGAYADTTSREEARRTLALPADARVACFVGRIRPYKGVDTLVSTFRQLTDPDVRLLVAGRCDDAALARSLQNDADADSRIRLELAKIRDDDLQVWLRAADISVLPYVDVLNSGSALLALSFDLPVLAPNIGALPDLAATVPGWVRLYAGELTAATLSSGLRDPLPTGRPELSAFDWDPIARATLALYETVLERRRASR